MKVKVIRVFTDKFNLSRIFNPGEVLDFEDERAENIVERGLGVPYIEEKPAPAKVEKPKTESVAEPQVEEMPVAEPKVKRPRKKKTQ